MCHRLPSLAYEIWVSSIGVFSSSLITIRLNSLEAVVVSSVIKFGTLLITFDGNGSCARGFPTLNEDLLDVIAKEVRVFLELIRGDDSLWVVVVAFVVCFLEAIAEVVDGRHSIEEGLGSCQWCRLLGSECLCLVWPFHVGYT